MNATISQINSDKENHQALQNVIDKAVELIMPSWPLDQSVAVNPWHSQTDKNFHEVLQIISSISNADMIIPHQVVNDLINDRSFNPVKLEKLLLKANLDMDVKSFIALLGQDHQVKRLKLLPQLADDLSPNHAHNWVELIHENITHACADYYTNVTQHSEGNTPGLYESWLTKNKFDYSIEFQTGEKGIVELIKSLPDNTTDMIHYALDTMGIAQGYNLRFIQSLLMSVFGWGSYTAYLRWSSNLNNQTNIDIKELLAIRLAWETILAKRFSNKGLLAKLTNQFESFDTVFDANSKLFALNKVCISLLEEHYQSKLLSDLKSNIQHPVSLQETRDAQLVFCIDVRSERIRRAIEKTDSRLETKGFAGFFGLSMGYEPDDINHTYRLLPALIAPSYSIKDQEANPNYSIDNLKIKSVKNSMFGNAVSMFSSVEIAGFQYGIKLFNQFFRKKTYNASDYDLQTPSKDIVCNTSGDSLSLSQRV